MPGYVKTKPHYRLTLAEVWEKVKESDREYQSALVRHYGKQAGNIRYEHDKQNAECRVLGNVFRYYVDLYHEMREAGE